MGSQHFRAGNATRRQLFRPTKQRETIQAIPCVQQGIQASSRQQPGIILTILLTNRLG
jgi:hypothetical protein